MALFRVQVSVQALSVGQLNSNAWATTGMSEGTSAFGDTNTSGDFAKRSK